MSSRDIGHRLRNNCYQYETFQIFKNIASGRARRGIGRKKPTQRLESVAWSYPHPLPGFELLVGYCSFYPVRVECYVDSAWVKPQPARFYGGWVTPELAGPYKGELGAQAL